jgi:regulatory protein
MYLLPFLPFSERKILLPHKFPFKYGKLLIEVRKMAMITKVTTQQKNQNRYNIFMDYGKGEEFAFSVDEDVLLKHQLKKGLELDEFSLMEIRYHDDIQKAYNTAISYLASRIRSEKEIRDHLLKKEMEEPVVQEVIHKLTDQKYINDMEYAQAYVRTQINTTDKGPCLIQTELKERGINPAFIEKALETFTFELQVEKAGMISKKFIQKNAKDSIRILKQKLENLLIRKGYSFEIANVAVSDIHIDKHVEAELEALRIQAEKAQKKYGKYTGFEYDQKMKQFLFRKGFSVEMIERILLEFKEMDER